MNRYGASVLGLLFAALLLAAAPLRAEDAATDWLKDATVKEPEKPSAEPEDGLSMRAFGGTKLADNDIYLFTPELWRAIQRYVEGDVFDMDTEIERQIAARPGVFSLYFFGGLTKVRRLLLAPEDRHDDERIISLFDTCVEKAQRAQQLPDFKLAGLFYETLCEAGHGLFSGIRGRFLDARQRGVRFMPALDALLEARPNLHGALMLKGMYNFYTGRFGTLTQLLLRLAGMPAGDEALGLKLIERAMADPSPVHYLAEVYAIYAFAPRWERRERALQIADDVIKNYPKNYYGYFLRAYVYDKLSAFAKARDDARKGRAMLPGTPESYKDIILRADIFILDARAAYLDVILDRNARSMAFLVEWARKKPGSYDYFDAPLIACLHAGHLFSLAGYDDKALAYYRRMQSFPGAEWMKDVGKHYEAKPIGQRIHLPPKQAKALKGWLDKHPEWLP